ncbi:hypothetical protein V6N11_044852 [Hibiscus sabdariffa]|uniref:Uncharacterized protein n=1 Tax=Hibiscus sabdariffa TaxID=183260 RepID=A0ABR2PU33_9ROSI
MATNIHGSGPTSYTNVALQNNSDDILMLFDQNDWFGSAKYPQVIQATNSAEFKHDADRTAQSSKGGVAYAVENGIKWVIAWSNLSSENNKVYIDITKEVVDWSSVELLLANSTFDPPSVTKYGFATTATIQSDIPRPLLIAELKKK